MATHKKKTESTDTLPNIIRGSHSTRTEYPDGRVEFETHWDELVSDVQMAILSAESRIPVAAEKPKRKRKEKL
jgi:hypothetical protein